MRWEGLSSMVKPSVVKNLKRVSNKGVKGNLKGEGKLLGGLLVVGGDNIAFEHREAVRKRLVGWAVCCTLEIYVRAVVTTDDMF